MRNKLIVPILITILCVGWKNLSYLFRWFVNVVFPGSISRYAQLYPILARSRVAPPNWLYYLIWPIVYLSFGLGIGCVQANTENGYRSILLLLGFIQIMLNFIYAFTFFGLGRIFHTSAWLLGMLAVLAFVTTVLCYLSEIRTIDGQHEAFWFFVPYTIWIMYACLIQRDIMRFGLY